MLFQSTLPCGSDQNGQTTDVPEQNFNPRSLAGATDEHIRWSPITGISIHAPLRERLSALTGHWSAKQFQSTLPCGSDASHNTHIFLLHAFQSTLPCGSDAENAKAAVIDCISIHAPLRERLLGKTLSYKLRLFQSTLPCGSDMSVPLVAVLAIRFQSTLPCGSDLFRPTYRRCQSNFNPRSLAGATSVYFRKMR